MTSENMEQETQGKTANNINNLADNQTQDTNTIKLLRLKASAETGNPGRVGE